MRKTEVIEGNVLRQNKTKQNLCSFSLHYNVLKKTHSFFSCVCFSLEISEISRQRMLLYSLQALLGVLVVQLLPKSICGYRNEYQNCTWPSQIKCVISYFTSRHRASSFDFLVTIGIWATDRPNIFISILQPRTGLCSEVRLLSARRTSQCPLGTLGTDRWAG